LHSLLQISASGCLLEVVIGIDPERDRAQIERLELPSLSLDYIDAVLTPRYEASGFKIREKGRVPPEDWAHLQTSWARRLQGNDRREVVYFIAEAQK
jgi:hypothetical protein